MKSRVGMAVLGLVLAAGVVMAARGQAPGYDHLVVRVSIHEAIQTEFKDYYGVHDKIKKRTPLDSLGEQGWELVSAQQDGKEFYCFLRRPRR